MSADFWASYLSGASGIIIGNPLDIAKVRLQAGETFHPTQSSLSRALNLRRLARGRSSWLRLHFTQVEISSVGSAAPILGYGALNSLLFVSYNRTLSVLDSSIKDYTKLSNVSLFNIWCAGFVGGLASWVVSAPSELIKCRTQLAAGDRSNSIAVFRSVLESNGWRGLYVGGSVTSLRDAVGYGF